MCSVEGQTPLGPPCPTKHVLQPSSTARAGRLSGLQASAGAGARIPPCVQKHALQLWACLHCRQQPAESGVWAYCASIPLFEAKSCDLWGPVLLAARRLANNCINLLAGSFHLAWEDPLNQPCQHPQPQATKPGTQHKDQSAPSHARQPPATIAAGGSSVVQAAPAGSVPESANAGQATAAGSGNGPAPEAALVGSAESSAVKDDVHAQAGSADSSGVSIAGNAQAGTASSASAGVASAGSVGAKDDGTAASSLGVASGHAQSSAASAGVAAGATAAQGATASDGGAAKAEAVGGGTAAGTAGTTVASDPHTALAGDAIGAGHSGFKTGRAQPGGASAFRDGNADGAGTGAAGAGQAAAAVQQGEEAQRGSGAAGRASGSGGGLGTVLPALPVATQSRVTVRPLEAATAEVDVRDLLKPREGATQA